MKRHLLAIALCLPGALFFGFYGLLAAGFGFAGTGSDFAKSCMLFGVVFGGASLGATPGLIMGYYQGLRWVCPFIGAAAATLCTVVVLFLVSSVVADVEQDSGDILLAALVLLGFIFGCWTFLRSYRSARGILRKPP